MSRIDIFHTFTKQWCDAVDGPHKNYIRNERTMHVVYRHSGTQFIVHSRVKRSEEAKMPHGINSRNIMYFGFERKLQQISFQSLNCSIFIFFEEGSMIGAVSYHLMHEDVFYDFFKWFRNVFPDLLVLTTSPLTRHSRQANRLHFGSGCDPQIQQAMLV